MSTTVTQDIKDAARDAAREVEHSARKLGRDAKDAFDEVTGNTTADAAKRAAADAAAAAKDMAYAAKDKAAEMAATARDKAADLADSAKDEAARLYRAGERKAGDLAVQAEDYYDEMSDMVRRQPAAALGIAAGVGFLVGLILARR